MFLLKSVKTLVNNQKSRPSLRTCGDFFLPSNVRSATTLQSVFEKWTSRFKEEKVSEVESSLKNILAHAIKTKRLGDVDKNKDLVLTESQLNSIEEMCQCRLARMPVQYIIGEWDFRDLTLKMIPPVFIPRPETEELVELILQQADIKKAFHFLEIGCGTGAISLAILNSLTEASSIAVDQSKLACELTMSNAKELKLSERIRIFKHKIAEDGLPVELTDEKFDMIVSNPPYVPSKQLRRLEPEIQIYEDLRALDGGDDGLKIIKSILQLSSKHLRTNGHLWLEVDVTHPDLIAKYVEENQDFNLKYVACYKDLFQKDRFVEILKV